jgi:exonuclease SbcC
MQIHQLRLVNFRQHEDTTLAFGLGLTGVLGPNGAGKTTLLEALAWALYGTRAARGTVEGIRRRSAPPRARVEVSVEFTLGPHRYRVVRTLHGAELYQDGDPDPIANSSSAVTERLGRIIGMSREEFFNTYFTGQKELAIMGSMTPMEREKFLSQVLGYERLTEVQRRLSGDRSTLRGQLQAIESLLAGAGMLAEEEAAAAARDAAAEEAGRLANEGLIAAEAEHGRVRPLWQAMQQLHDQVRSLESDLRVAEQQVTDGRDAFTRLDRELAEALTIRQRLDQLAPIVEPVAALQAERAKLDLLAAKMARRREALGQVGELRRRVKAIDERIATLPTAEGVAAIRAALKERREALEAATEQAEERRTHWVREKQDVETKAGQLTAQGTDLRAQLKALEKAGPKGACPTCNRPLGASYDDVIGDLKAQINEVAVNFKFYRSRIKQFEKEPKEVADALKARDKLQADVQKATNELGRAESGEQTRTTLAAERVGHAARMVELVTLVGAAAEEFDDARHAAVRAELERLEPMRAEFERLSGSADRAARLAAEAAAVEAELTRREAKVIELRHALQQSGWSPEEFAIVQKSLEAAERARQDAQLAVVKAAGDRENARAELKRIGERRAERERQAAEARRVELKLSQNQELDRAVADLRTDLNETLRPDLSDLGSQLLAELTMGRYTVFELDEDYAPTIVDDGEPQRVLSGGEEDIVSLALRLSISQMIAERAGQPLSLLVLDEVFGSLDEERRSALIDLLRRLADRFPQVILITHVDSVREGFDHVFRLDYDVERGVVRVRNGGSGSQDAAA